MPVSSSEASPQTPKPASVAWATENLTQMPSVRSPKAASEASPQTPKPASVAVESENSARSPSIRIPQTARPARGIWGFACVLWLLIAVAPTLATIPIGGKVVGNGRPVRGAEAQLLPLASEYELGRLHLGMRTDPEPVATARTDARGRFHLAAPGPGMWTVRVEAQGYSPRELLLQPLMDATELPVVEMRSASTLRVQIKDSADRPLQATVAAFRQSLSTSRLRESWGAPHRSGGGWRSRLSIAGTDTIGTVRLPASNTGDWSVAVVAAGYLPRQQAVGRQPFLELRMKPGEPRSLAVVEGRRPVASTLIYVAGMALPIAMTDMEGRATIAAPSDQLTELTLASPQGHRGSHHLAPLAEGATGKLTETIRLVPPQPWSGRVIDRRSREPIAGALVWIRSPFRAALTTTDVRGGYTLTTSEDRPVYVSAAASGYAVSGSLRDSGEGEDGPTIALAPAGKLGGLVADREDRPLGEVEVAVLPQPGGGDATAATGLFGGSWLTRSSSRGSFLLTGLPAGNGYILRFTKTGFAPAELRVRSLTPFEERTDLRAALDRGRRGVGLVVDEEDRPVAGAEVRWIPSPAAGGGSELPPPPEDVPVHLTGVDGLFAIPNLQAGRFDLSVTADGFSPTTVPGLWIAEGKGEIDLGAVIMQPGAAIEGRVIDTLGEPVAGAEVRAGETGEIVPTAALLMIAAQPPLASSDQEGRFTISDRRPNDRLDLSVTKAGYVTAMVPQVSVPSEQPVEVVLQPTAKIAGRVIDERHQPVVAAQIWLQPEGQTIVGGDHLSVTAGERRVESGEDGLFEVSAVKPGLYTIHATAPRFQSLQLAGLEVNAGEAKRDLELTLERGATLAGSVRRVGGEPVDGALVSAAVAGAGTADRAEAHTRTDADGRFELLGLGLSEHRVVAEDSRGRRGEHTMELVPGTQMVELILEGGVPVSGRVRDTVGYVVEGATVLVTSEQAGAGGGRIAQSRTDADGDFLFSDLLPGTYVLFAGREGFAMTRHEEPIEIVDSPIHGLELELEPGVTLSGRILGLDFDDLAKVLVRAYGSGGVVGATAAARVDYEGRYAIRHLLPGVLTVVAKLPGSGRQVQEQLVLEIGSTEASLDLEFGHGHVLTGEVFHNGSPAIAAQLDLSGLDVSHQAASITGRDGSFRVDGLLEGTYRLALRSYETGLEYHRDISIRSDEVLRIDVETVRLVGRVLDNLDASPIPGAGLTLERFDPTGRAVPGPKRQVTSDASGHFSLGQVSTGRYTLAASKPGYARAVATVELQAGSAEENLELAMISQPRR